MATRNDTAMWSGLFRISAGFGPDAAGADPAGDRRRHSRPPDRRLHAAAVMPHPGRKAGRGARHRGAGLPAARRPGLSDCPRKARAFRQSRGADDAGQAAARAAHGGGDRLEGAAQDRRQRNAATPPSTRTGSSLPIPFVYGQFDPALFPDRRVARMQPHGAGGAGNPQLGGRHGGSRRPAADRADPGAAVAPARHLRQSRTRSSSRWAPRTRSTCWPRC